MVQPFLDNGLSVGACNAYDGNIKAAAVAFGQMLERFQGICNHIKGGSGKATRIIVGQSAHHKITHTAAVKICHVFVAIIALRAQSEEKRSFRKGQRAAIRQKPINIFVGVGSKPTRINERCDLFRGIVHNAWVLSCSEKSSSNGYYVCGRCKAALYALRFWRTRSKSAGAKLHSFNLSQI